MYSIYNQTAAKYVGVVNNQSGSAVQLVSSGSSDYAKWHIIDLGGGRYSFQNIGSSLLMNLKGGSTGNWSEIIQWGSSGNYGWNEIFSLILVSSGNNPAPTPQPSPNPVQPALLKPTLNANGVYEGMTVPANQTFSVSGQYYSGTTHLYLKMRRTSPNETNQRLNTLVEASGGNWWHTIPANLMKLGTYNLSIRAARSVSEQNCNDYDCKNHSDTTITIYVKAVGAPQTVLNWIDSSVGTQYGNGQCVILINAYLTKFWNITTAGKGINSAYQIPNMTFPTGWRKIPYYQGFIPQPGDIAIWNQYYNGSSIHGHTAIIISATECSMVTLDQNWGNLSAQKVYNHTYTGFWGVIRPIY